MVSPLIATELPKLSLAAPSPGNVCDCSTQSHPTDPSDAGSGAARLNNELTRLNEGPPAEAAIVAAVSAANSATVPIKYRDLIAILIRFFIASPSESGDDGRL
jgi:hypothetical protein